MKIKKIFTAAMLAAMVCGAPAQATSISFFLNQSNEALLPDGN